MARQANKSIEAADLEKYLEQEEGFALEMAALKACKANRAQAEHGGSYLDPQSGRSRQFDIRAQLGPNYGDCSLRMAIECKTLGVKFPLLVSRLPREAHERRSCFLKTEIGSGDTLISQKVLQRENGSSLYRRGEMVGKGMARVGIKRAKGKEDEFVSNDEEVFAKWDQALASCHDLVATAWKDSSQVQRTVYTFVMPILLLGDGDLWVADYASDGSLEEGPRQVESCEFFVNHSIQCDTGLPYGNIEYVASHLHIFTLSGFRKFVDRRRIDANFDHIFYASQLREL